MTSKPIKTIDIEKAYGGCHKCYGKGYSTVWSGVSGSADFIGDRSYVTQPKNNIKYCTCDRGTQLKQLIVRERRETASAIFNLAHEYAQQDTTMIGSEDLRHYHYYNAIAKIGEFDGR